MILSRLVALVALVLPACAYRSGGTLADGSTRWQEFTMGTDTTGATVTPAGMTVAQQNQSKVAGQAIKTAGTLGTAAITAGMLEGMNADNNAVTVAESNNALGATKAKEATKLGVDGNKTKVKLFEAEAKELP